MSWEAYMTSLDGFTSNKMHYGAIYGLDGNSWTSKGPLTVTKDEALSLVKICHNNDTETTKAQSGGIFLDSKKFRFLRSDSEEKSVTFVRNEGDKLHNGFAITTKMALIICLCEEDAKSSTATSGTCKLAEYLVSLGYWLVICGVFRCSTVWKLHGDSRPHSVMDKRECYELQ